MWKDDRCVAFLSINPLAPGHTLVVPRDEVDHWIDAEPGLIAHLTSVARDLGRALHAAFSPTKVGMMIAGLEVAHLHRHLVPMRDVHDLDVANAEADPDPADLDHAAEQIRTALRAAGHLHVDG